MHLDRTCDVLSPAAAEDRHGQFGASRTHQSGDPNHFARADVEAHVPDYLPVGVFGMVDRPVGDAHDAIAYLRCTVGIAVFHRAADHVAHDAVLGNAPVSRVETGNGMAVADNGHGVSDTAHLVQLVADNDLRHPLFLEF